MQTIRVIIVDDIRNTRESIRRILSLDSTFEVVGEAGCGSDAIRLIELLKPDIVLMDVSMPDIDGIKTAELLSFRAPNTSVIMMSVETDSEKMTKAMMAGAKAYIAKPFTGTELTSAIMNVYHKETRKRELIMSPSPLPVPEVNDTLAKIICLFSTKGGVGKTTTAVNLAVELAKSKYPKTLLIDLNLQFGDVASFLNLVPKRTISDLAQVNSIKYEDIRFHILPHSSGVEILAASSRPEYADLVTPEHVQQILEEVSPHYDFIVIDSTNRFDDISLVSLEAANDIWIVVGMDIPAIKNTKLSLEVLHSLEYAQNVKLILNKFHKRIGIPIKDIESSLGMKVNFVLPEEEQITSILNKGIPFVEAFPRSPLAQEVKKMVNDLIASINQKKKKLKMKNKKVQDFKKLLGLGR